MVLDTEEAVLVLIGVCSQLYIGKVIGSRAARRSCDIFRNFNRLKVVDSLVEMCQPSTLLVLGLSCI